MKDTRQCCHRNSDEISRRKLTRLPMDPVSPLPHGLGRTLRSVTTVGTALALALCAGDAFAKTESPLPDGLKVSGSGFYTLGVAKAVRVRPAIPESGLRCECFVTEYSQGGVHEDGRLGYRADSKLGLQGAVATVDDRWSVTGQLVARGAHDGKPRLEWLYASYQLSGSWTTQFGRKRLPILSHSEAQDVGIAIPWVRLPTQLYGWDIVNFNGGNLLWRGTWGSWAVLVNAYAGSETRKDSPYEALYYSDGSRTDTRWGGIRGIELAAQWGHIKLRAATVKARSSYVFTAPGESAEFFPGAELRLSTLAASFEPGPWTFSAEGLYGDRRQEYGLDKSWSVQAGRRFGDLQVLLAHSSYREVANDPAASAEGDETTSVVLRWDAAPGRAWKLQFDDFRDKSRGDFSVGSRRLVSVSYSGVF